MAKRFNRRRRMRGRKLNKRQVKQVKKIINIQSELKYFPFNQTGFSVTSTSVLTGASFDVTQGLTDTSRIGDQLTLAGSIDFRLHLSSADSYNIIRWILIQWHPTSTTTPFPATDGSDVLVAGPSTAIDYLSMYNHDKRSDYTVLFDKTYTLVGNGTSGTYPYTTSSQIVKHYRISLKKASKKVQFVGAGLQASNRLFWIYVSDSSGVSHPQAAYSSKLFFRDL